MYSVLGEKIIMLVLRLWGLTQSEGMRVMKWNIPASKAKGVTVILVVVNYMMFNRKGRAPEMSPEVSKGKHKYSAVLLDTCYFLS